MENGIFKKGLTTHQAEKLLEQYGQNEIKEERRFTLLSSFFAQFNNFLTKIAIINLSMAHRFYKNTRRSGMWNKVRWGKPDILLPIVDNRIKMK